jgi:hypothetical protein
VKIIFKTLPAVISQTKALRGEKETRPVFQGASLEQR